MIKEHINNREMEEEFWIGETSLDEFKKGLVRCQYVYMMVCVEGEAEIEVNFEKKHLSPYTRQILFPLSMVKITDWSDDFKMAAIIGTMEFVHQSCAKLETWVFPFILKYDNQIVANTEEMQRGLDTFKYLKQIYNDKESLVRREVIQLQLRCMFLTVYDYTKRNIELTEMPGTKNNSRPHALFQQFMEEVFKQAGKHRDVEFYADKLCITPRYLNSIVRLVTRKNAKKLIDEQAVTMLKRTLLATNSSIQEIAYDYGFPTQSFFGRYFKQRVGTSPTEFRNRHNYD